MVEDKPNILDKETSAESNAAEKSLSAGAVASDGRRKVIKAGLTGIPVLLTLRGTPAWTGVGVQGTSTATPGTTVQTAPSTLDNPPTTGL